MVELEQTDTGEADAIGTGPRERVARGTFPGGPQEGGSRSVGFEKNVSWKTANGAT